MEKTLGQFVKEKSNFISLGDKEFYSGIYQGYKFIEKEIRGETHEVARYLIEDLEDRQVRNFDSQSIGLAKKMDKVPVGSLVKIGRAGEGFDTKYTVEYGDFKKKNVNIEGDDEPIIEEPKEGEEIPIIEEDEKP